MNMSLGRGNAPTLSLRKMLECLGVKIDIKVLSNWGYHLMRKHKDYQRQSD